MFASTYEGFGLPILEAQAIGRPVITSQQPPMCDVAGKGAVLVDPFDPSAIRHGLERIVQDPCVSRKSDSPWIRECERDTVPDQIAAKYAELYRRLG